MIRRALEALGALTFVLVLVALVDRPARAGFTPSLPGPAVRLPNTQVSTPIMTRTGEGLATYDAGFAVFPAVYVSKSRTDTGSWYSVAGFQTMVLHVVITVGGTKSATLYVSTTMSTTGQPLNGQHGFDVLTIVESGYYIVRQPQLGGGYAKVRIAATNGATVSVEALYLQADISPTVFQTTDAAAITANTAAAAASAATMATGITYSASLYGSITNTCYMQSWTTTVTGFAGWIDCRGASQLVFTVQVAAKADHVAHAGSGVSMFVDSSGELAVNLPTTASDSAWNNTLSPSPGFYMTASTVTIDNPAAAVRLRWHIGSTGNVGYGPTATVMYTLKFPGKGPNGTEAGPTPPMH